MAPSTALLQRQSGVHERGVSFGFQQHRQTDGRKCRRRHAACIRLSAGMRGVCVFGGPSHLPTTPSWIISRLHVDEDLLTHTLHAPQSANHGGSYSRHVM